MKTPPENYTYAVGKIRALEKFLLKQSVFEEAIESDLSDALRLFTENGIYSSELLHIKDSRGLEDILNRELLSLKKVVRGMLLDKELIDVVEKDGLASYKALLELDFSEPLKDYIKHFLDMHNIKTFLRLYVLKEPQEKLAKLLVCEGFIEIKELLWLYSRELALLFNRLEYVHKRGRVVDYAAFLKEPIEDAVKEKSFIALEKAIGDFLIQALLPSKYVSFGPQPVMAYYFARLNEINLIRMIILAKLNPAASGLSRERLNLAYA